MKEASPAENGDRSRSGSVEANGDAAENGGED